MLAPQHALAARHLHEHGFAVIPEAIIPASRADRLAAACSERLSRLLTQVEEIGYDPLEQSYQFAELCHRQRLRWDMQPSFEEAQLRDDWAEMCADVLDETARGQAQKQPVDVAHETQRLIY